MIKEITGYKFQVEQAATNAQNALRVHFLDGRPPAPPEGYTTTEWVSVKHNDGVSGTFFYFYGSFAPILGQPEVFNIDISDDI
jgi:hypothetical protein